MIERYGSLELYNLAKDLGETRNLATCMPEKAARRAPMPPTRGRLSRPHRFVTADGANCGFLFAVQVVVDGANGLKENLEQLFPKAIFTLDVFHVVEKLSGPSLVSSPYT